MTDQPEKFDLTSGDIIGEKLQELLEIFPEVRTEGGKIDFERLKAVLGVKVDAGKERYGLNWPGKADCLKTIQQPSLGTLLPCPAESVNFDTTENLFIEGDNLEALKLLQKSYLGKVKMIYIDPPYNTGNDFIYPDNFTESLQTYLEYTGQVDAEGKKFGTNTEADGRFHSKWLNMMYSRLYLAKNLLREDGVIFISIDDHEVDNLKKLCNEIFGEENFAAQFPWRKRTAKSDVPFGVSQDYEWILCFARSNSFVAGIAGSEGRYYETPDFPNRPWRIHDMTTQRTAQERPNSNFTIVNPKNGIKYPVNPNAVWRVTDKTFKTFYDKNRIVFPDDYDFLKISQPVLRYFKEDDKDKSGDMFGYLPVTTNLPKEVGMTQDGTKDIGDLFDNKVFSFPKPVGLIKHFVKIATSIDKTAIIMDFFSGSATTAQAILSTNKEDQGNRKFVMIQLPELCDENSDAFKAGYKNIAEIGKERIRRAIKKLNEADAAKPNPAAPMQDRGFRVFKLAESNFKTWDAQGAHDAAGLEKQLELHIAHIRADRSPDDILAEIILKSGFSLTVPAVKLDLAGKTVFNIADGALFICLEHELTLPLIRAIAAKKPARVVCLDAGFAGNDQLKTNAVLIFKNQGVTSFKTI